MLPSLEDYKTANHWYFLLLNFFLYRPTSWYNHTLVRY